MFVTINQTPIKGNAIQYVLNMFIILLRFLSGVQNIIATYTILDVHNSADHCEQTLKIVTYFMYLPWDSKLDTCINYEKSSLLLFIFQWGHEQSAILKVNQPC